jgi:hypothetical protein
MKTTLVIQPADPSTDFLKVIYEGRNFTEVTSNFEPNNLKELILNHDRIVMLGHGFHHGLLNYYQTIIDKSFVPMLKTKELVGIWCFAKTFFDEHGLAGFHTDMFISETMEASVMGVNATEGEIKTSNLIFAKAVRSYLFHPDCLNKVKSCYGKLNSDVSKYNFERLNYRQVNDPQIKNNLPDFGNILKNILSQGKL